MWLTIVLERHLLPGSNVKIRFNAPSPGFAFQQRECTTSRREFLWKNFHSARIKFSPRMLSRFCFPAGFSPGTWRRVFFLGGIQASTDFSAGFLPRYAAGVIFISLTGVIFSLTGLMFRLTGVQTFTAIYLITAAVYGQDSIMAILRSLHLKKSVVYIQSAFYPWYTSSYICWELSPLLRSPCVPCAFPLSICITVESMTSPIVITQGKNAFLHTNEVPSQLGKKRSSILISVALIQYKQ